MIGPNGFITRLQNERVIKTVFDAKKEEIKNLKIRKMYDGKIEIEYHVKRYEVYLTINEKREVEFSTINLNYYQNKMNKEYLRKMNEWATYFIQNDKNRLRLII